MGRGDEDGPLDTFRLLLSARLEGTGYRSGAERICSHVLRPTERVVLMALVRRRNNDTHDCYPSLQTLSEDTGLSVTGVRGVLERLDRAGLIDQQKRPGTATRYKLHILPLKQPCKLPTDCKELAHCKLLERSVQGAFQEPTTTPDRTAQGTTEELLGEETPDPEYASDVLFERFWRTYPERAGHNPEAKARRAWDELVEAGVRLENVMNGLSRYRRYLQARNQVGTRFVKHAANFLDATDRLWEDDWDPQATNRADRARSERDRPHVTRVNDGPRTAEGSPYNDRVGGAEG